MSLARPRFSWILFLGVTLLLIGIYCAEDFGQQARRSGPINKEPNPEIINESNYSATRYDDDSNYGIATITQTTSTSSSSEISTEEFVTTTIESTTSLLTEITVTEASITSNDSNTVTVTPQLVCPLDIYHCTNLLYEETPAGTWAVPHGIAKRSYYLPVNRYCFNNGSWSMIYTNCSKTVSVTNTTSKLYRLLSEDSVTALSKTLEIVNDAFDNELQPIDIHFISQILDKANQDDQVVDQFDNLYEIVDKLMRIKKDILQSSQQLLNSTDNILYNLDKLLLKTTKAKFYSLSSLLVHTVYTSGGVIGGMIKNNSKDDTFTDFQVIPLYVHNSTEELAETDFEVAFQVPKAITQNHNYYYITLFYNDHLFNQELNNTVLAVGSWIISILIPDVSTDDNSSIRIYFKQFAKNLYPQCDHWHYGEDENHLPIKGQWTYDNEAIKFKEDIYICELNHTTHFGLLDSDWFADIAYGDKVYSVLASGLFDILDYLTNVGTIVSIVGIAIIFLTLLLFKNWRNNPSNIIILNVSVCSLLIIIILFFIFGSTTLTALL